MVLCAGLILSCAFVLNTSIASAEFDSFPKLGTIHHLSNTACVAASLSVLPCDEFGLKNMRNKKEKRKKEGQSDAGTKNRGKEEAKRGCDPFLERVMNANILDLTALMLG